MCQSYATTATWSEFQQDVSHCRDLWVYQHLVGVVRPKTFHHHTNQLFFSDNDVLSVTTSPSRLSVCLCSFLLHSDGNVCRLGKEERQKQRQKAALCSAHMFATLSSKHISLWLEKSQWSPLSPSALLLSFKQQMSIEVCQHMTNRLLWSVDSPSHSWPNTNICSHEKAAFKSTAWKQPLEKNLELHIPAHPHMKLHPGAAEKQSQRCVRGGKSHAILLHSGAKRRLLMRM